MCNTISLRIPVAKARTLNQMQEFFFFGCLLVLDMAIFIFLAWRYALLEKCWWFSLYVTVSLIPDKIK